MARSIPVGGIHVSITGNSVDFRKAVKSAKSEIWKLKAAFTPLTSAARTAGLALAAFGGGAALMHRNLAEGIDRLGKLSTSLRTTVADLQAFEMAAGLQGVDFTKATNGLKKLEVVVGQIASGRAYSEVTEEWDKLGLKIEDLIKLPVVEQFERITAAIKEMVPVGEQAATASAFFGTRNAADVLRMTTETMEQSRAALKRFGIELTQTAARDTEALNDAMLVLSLIFKNFARNIVAEHAPAIKQWVKQIQAGLAPGGRLREVLDKVATAFRMAAQATVEFVDIMSSVITRGRVMAVAIGAVVLAGSKITLMVGTAVLALGRFAAAMITGQSIASGFAVVLGALRGGVFGVVATLATLGVATAGGIAIYRTLTAEMQVANATQSEADGLVQGLATKYDALRASVDGVTTSLEDMAAATRKSMETDIAALRAKAAVLEAEIRTGPAFTDLSKRIEAAQARQTAAAAALAAGPSGGPGHMAPGAFMAEQSGIVSGTAEEIANLNKEQLALLEPVWELLDEADRWSEKLRTEFRTTKETGEAAFTDLGEAARTAFDNMDKGFGSWYDKYMEGMADVGDMFDQFAKDALKHLVKIWAFQPMMGVFGGGLGSIPGFADGGFHRGGARIVGEHGPELEVTGPSRIYNSRDTRRMLGGGLDVRITVGGDLANMRDQIASQISAAVPEITERIVGRVAMDAARPSSINSNIRSAR